MFEILLVDHLLILFLYYRNYDFVFTFHVNTIISILFINNSKCHTERCPWEYNLNLPSNVASKTIEKKKTVMFSKQIHCHFVKKEERVHAWQSNVIKYYWTNWLQKKKKKKSLAGVHCSFSLYCSAPRRCKRASVSPHHFL